MAWWAIFFVAILSTIIGKFYFTTACNRLRQSLVRRQREALELKGVLADTRQEHQLLLRACREKEVGIKRLQSQIATLQGNIERVEAKIESQSSEKPTRKRR
jgi:chromosome segregation ATPase